MPTKKKGEEDDKKSETERTTEAREVFVRFFRPFPVYRFRTSYILSPVSIQNPHRRTFLHAQIVPLHNALVPPNNGVMWAPEISFSPFPPMPISSTLRSASPSLKATPAANLTYLSIKTPTTLLHTHALKGSAPPPPAAAAARGARGSSPPGPWATPARAPGHGGSPPPSW